jgi:hypothetical protein
VFAARPVAPATPLSAATATPPVTSGLAAELVQEVCVLAIHLATAASAPAPAAAPSIALPRWRSSSAAAAAAAAATTTPVVHTIPISVHLLLLLLDVKAPRSVRSRPAPGASLLYPRQLTHFVLEVVLVVAKGAVDHGQFAQLIKNLESQCPSTFTI